jgi:hypothetical protein
LFVIATARVDATRAVEIEARVAWRGRTAVGRAARAGGFGLRVGGYVAAGPRYTMPPVPGLGVRRR